MLGVEHTLIALLVVLSTGLIIPEVFKNKKFPFAIFLIIFGAILGPNATNYIQTDSTIEFFGFLGSTFLMFMAGLEIKLDTVKRFGKDILVMALSNSLFPFSVGLIITLFFGYSFTTALLIGTIFISSSVAIVSISLESTGLMHRKISKAILSSTVIQDTASLLILSMLLKNSSNVLANSPIIYLAVLILSVIALKVVLPVVTKKFLDEKRHENRERYEGELQFVLATLFLAALYFLSIGVHPIVASFIIGILLSDIVTSKHIRNKLHTIGYGLFIPVFFFVVGMEIDLHLFLQMQSSYSFTFAMIIGLILSKWISGRSSARAVGFSKEESNIFGVSSTVQLTTTLAAVYAASSEGLLSPAITTSIIVLSVFTTLVMPIMLSWMATRLKKTPQKA